MLLEERLGKAIIMRRRRKLISQEDLARKAGVTRSYMSNIENGKRVVSLAVIAKICSALDITLAELFEEL